jgi:hypothetical protein
MRAYGWAWHACDMDGTWATCAESLAQLGAWGRRGAPELFEDFVSSGLHPAVVW